jgi:hypothetical protein
MTVFAAMLRNTTTCGIAPTWPAPLQRGVPAFAFAKARPVPRKRIVSHFEISAVFIASAIVIAASQLVECIALIH